MRRLMGVSLALALLLGVAAVAVAAAEQTLTGNVTCAKCTLKKAEATKCQDVLVVKTDTATAEYYIAKNAVAEKFGHQCSGERAAVVTGTVVEKDGKTWITATKMEEKK